MIVSSLEARVLTHFQNKRQVQESPIKGALFLPNYIIIRKVKKSNDFWTFIIFFQIVHKTNYILTVLIHFSNALLSALRANNCSAAKSPSR